MNKKLDDMSLESTIKHLRLELEQLKQARTEPIAVIGIGCRFPGGSNSPQAFWQMLAEGRDCIQEVPVERYDIDEFHHSDLNMPGKTVSRWGSFLDHVDQFDAAFFGISPREATIMDPQQRILVEVMWEALERAGLPQEKLAGSSTGVFMGLFNNDYKDCVFEQSVADRGASADGYMATGTALSFAAGRISYLLGLQGPSMAVDTVCSSSLVVLHLACQSLRNNECSMALAGAVDLNLHPFHNLLCSKMRVLSPRGRSRTFDASADGFVRGEGCGVLVLKRHSQALADGDPILALIRGSAVNHDGRSKGLTAPNGKAQEAVLRQALQNAGVSPEQISYIEAHGTGTRLGDPIEFEALKAVFGQARPKGSVCTLGSVKTNIGHLEAAAGMAGLVKTIMCMQRQAIPPHLHLETLNPRISLENTPFVIQKDLSHWAVSAGPRYAGVSASGLSGTNAHVVLEEVCESTRIDNQLSPQCTGETWFLPLSAKNANGLRQLAETWYTELQSPNLLSNFILRHICFTASLRRTHHQQRLALVGASHEELTSQLEAFLVEELAPCIRSGSASSVNHHPVFVFSGQGAQWAGMGQELCRQEPVFRATIEKCDTLLRRYVSWSLLEELQADKAQSRLHETAIAQPALFSLQVALTELWRSWGIQPAAVVGHSVGEITAAYVAGVLDLEDAIRVVAQRSILMQQTHGLGLMAAVEISETQARKYIVDYAGRVVIAAINSPTSVVLSGETGALQEILEKMLVSNIVGRQLNVEGAFHSPQMDRLRIPLIESLEGITARPGKLVLLSTVTGEVSSGEEHDAAYWGSNMCQTVYFGAAIEKLVSMGYNTFLEISPQPALATSLKQILSHHDQSGCVLPSMRRGIDERTTMLTSLGALYTQGHRIKWEQLYRASREPDKVVCLPTYPWQHKRYWFSEKKPFSQHTIVPSGRWTGHPLLARSVRSATRDSIFEVTISTKILHWLNDHEASGMKVFPASAYVEMMLQSVRIALSYANVRITDLFIHEALTFSAGQERILQLVLKSTSGNIVGEIEILSCSENEKADIWTLHATCNYQPVGPAASVVTIAERTDLDLVRQRCTEVTLGWEHYQSMQASGLFYGPAFQALQQIWWRHDEALGQLCLPQQLTREQGSYFMHPAFLDACLHTAAATVAAVAGDGRGDMYLPFSMDSVFFNQRPGNEVWVHIEVSRRDLKHGIVIARVHVLSDRGEPIALIDGLHLRRASQSALGGKAKISPKHWLYKLQWEPKAHQGTLEGYRVVSPRSWLFFCDSNGTGTRLAADLRARGEQCFLIFPDQRYETMEESGDYTLDPFRPEHFETFLEEVAPFLKYPRCSIVYLWAVDAVATGERTSEQFTLEQQRLCGGLLHLVQALVQRRWATSPQLWVITRNSQDVKVPSVRIADASALTQTSLWGLGRVIALEHPDIHCRLVDFPDQISWDTEKFLEELVDPELEDQIALRMEGRYIARLAVAESDAPFLRKHKLHTHTAAQGHGALQFSATGTYLITGGLGGLGIAIGQWMVEERDARHLVLTGRSARIPEPLSIISRLEQRGAQKLVVQADVTDQKQLPN